MIQSKYIQIQSTFYTLPQLVDSWDGISLLLNKTKSVLIYPAHNIASVPSPGETPRSSESQAASNDATSQD